MTRVRFVERGGVVLGYIDVNTGAPGTVSVCALGDSKADALHRAALVAERIVSDPVIRAIMPPQAQQAINATRALAVAAKRGLPTLRRVFGALRGPGKQRLAVALAKEQAEVGWNPFKRKKKRAARKAVGPMRVRAPARAVPSSPEPEEPEADEAEAEESEE